MDIIINELSLTGFANDTDFASKYKEYTHQIFKVIENLIACELYNIQLPTKSDILSITVTPTENLQQIIYNRNKPQGISFDIFRSLKSTLSRLFLSTPFWDIRQQHTCDDTYKTISTSDTCNYSIAEACERDSLILSFYNDTFKDIKEIEVLKNNTEKFKICNIFNQDQLWECLIGIKPNEIRVLPNEWQVRINRNPTPNLFPLEIDIEKLLNLKKIKTDRIHLSVSDRITHDKYIAKIVASIYYWTYNRVISNKNPETKKHPSRTIYSAGSRGQIMYISIDTLHARFELFDKKGKHKGEYDFNGNRKKEAEKGRYINV